MDFAAMAELCAPGVAYGTLHSIASVESSFNPFAIGVVGGRLHRQPRDLAEARATTRMLAQQGFDYSVGLIQVNQKNFAKYGVTAETAFDPCVNLRVGSLIFKDCFERAGEGERRLGDALSCYYSGNFTTGYRLGYVAKVQAAYPNAALPGLAIPVVADAKPRKGAKPKERSRAAEPLFVSNQSAQPTTDAAPASSPSTPLSKNTALLF